MAHPDLFALGLEPALEQIELFRLEADVGAAEFRRPLAALHLAAQHLHHHLLTVADAEDRYAQIEDLLRGSRTACVDHGSRAAGEDHGAGFEVSQEGRIHRVEGVDLTKDVQLAQAARDELGHLAAEVDDQQAVVGGGGDDLGHGA